MNLNVIGRAVNTITVFIIINEVIEGKNTEALN